MKKKLVDKPEGYTDKQIVVSLKESVVRSLNPVGGAAVGEDKQAVRLRRLRAYAKAVVDSLIPDVYDGYLSHRELVAVFISAATFTQLQYVMKEEDDSISVDELVNKIKRS